MIQDLGFYATGDTTYFSTPRVIERPLLADRSFATILADAVTNKALDEFGRVRDRYTVESEPDPDDRSICQRLVPFVEWLADQPETDATLPPALSALTVWQAINAVKTNSGPPETVVSALCAETEVG